MDISTVSFELLLVYFFFGLGVLTIGAHWFVEGAVSLSVRLGIPKIIIGSVVMSLATTSPEVIVSIVSVLKHQEKIALGNIFGSFVANLGLVLGISGLIRPITVSYVILHRQLPFVIGALGHTGASKCIVFHLMSSAKPTSSTRGDNGRPRKAASVANVAPRTRAA